ncbi:choline/ethanolamine kinase-like [Sarcoptes scabiei]|nr:choline/ethanolamine kinase-like [Sarcoptes scabiei]
MNKERAEIELGLLLKKAKNSISNELDNCFDWIDDETRKAKKLLDQIEKIQRQMPAIDAKLFNESRDCCDDLQTWIKRLQGHRESMLKNDQKIVVQTLDEMGSMNDGFKRSRNILFTK